MKTTKKTNLGRSLLCHIGAARTTQWAISHAAGISHVALSRIISRGYRPEPDTLRGICHAMPDRLSGVEVLCAHLRDEIDRAQYLQDEVSVGPHRVLSSTEPTDIEQTVDRLMVVARQRADVARLLAALAVVCEGLDESDAPPMIGASAAPGWSVDRVAESAGKKYASVKSAKKPNKNA